MGERYLLSGVQIGILIALPTKKDRLEFYEKTLSMQYLTSTKKGVLDDCIHINKLLRKKRR